MPTAKRLSEASVIERLLAEPQRFQFGQAVRLLLRWLRRNGVADERAVLQFRNSLALTFPASEIEALQTEPGSFESAARLLDALRHGDAARFTLTPAFLGLLGVHGGLPFTVTERIAAAQRWGDDDSGRAFVDIFTQRLTTLFFEATSKFRLEQSLDADGTDTRLPLLLALAGIRNALTRSAQEKAGAIPEDVMAHYAGLLRTRPASANAVAQVLSDYFAVPIALEPFVGNWDYVPENKRARLGSRTCAGAKLGHGAMLGDRIWRRDLQATIHIGPVGRADFERFLPGTPGAAALENMLALFGLPSLTFDVRLHLKPSAARRVVLTTRKPEEASRLGWDAHLGGAADKVARTETGYMLKPSGAAKRLDHTTASKES